MVNIILDLDETLIHTIQISPDFNRNLANLSDFWFNVGGQYYWVQKRPGLKMFLDFLYRYFNVGIWTAAEKEYAKEICRNILTVDQLHKTHFIYSRNFCHLDTAMIPVMFTKPLAKIYQLHPEFNQMNTIMIDNNANVMRHNNHNGIHVADFIGQRDDKTLWKLRNLIVQYYKKVPMHLPVWGIVNVINGELTNDHDMIVNGRRKKSPNKMMAGRPKIR